MYMQVCPRCVDFSLRNIYFYGQHRNNSDSVITWPEKYYVCEYFRIYEILSNTSNMHKTSALHTLTVKSGYDS